MATVAILAGGAATRMGLDKAEISIAGIPMVELVVAETRRLDADVVLVGGPPRAGIPVLDDLRPGRRGPLAGLEAALVRGGGPVVLVAVDQPYVRAETLEGLLALDGDAVVPVDAGHPQVTCAVYRRTCLPAVQALLDDADGANLRGVLARVETTRVEEATWRGWGEDGRSWFSVDDPIRLDEALRRFGAPRLRSLP